ncbi:MAG TPA: HD-GYP domain-containing protein [Fusibacter sp.]|nr:HD-GYP domain-containing protein [Fusibacter sp.]
MRLKSLEHVEVGDILGKPVYDDKCKLLLAKDVILTQNYIDRLKKANVQCVFIEDELSEGLEATYIVSDTLKIQSVMTVKNAFKDLAERKGTNYNIKSIDSIKQVVDDMMRVIYDNPHTLYCMTELMGTDMYTYNHSAEVAVLSMLVAKSMKLNDTFIQKIGIGAILHDIGKMSIPAELLNKVEPLSEDEIKKVKDHVQIGYDLLKDNDFISPISRQIVLLHHEKLNGSGYPYMLSGDDIPIHVRIVTLCDIFNAISSNRAYKGRINADEALETIRAEAIYELDRDIYYHLLKVVNIYPVGTLVELSNGEIGIIIKENLDAQTRPVVQIIRDKKREEIVNLMDYLTLFITKTVDI